MRNVANMQPSTIDVCKDTNFENYDTRNLRCIGKMEVEPRARNVRNVKGPRIMTAVQEGILQNIRQNEGVETVRENCDTVEKRRRCWIRTK